ncbi:MAG: TRAP transporter large permease [Myxococcota bacterium]|jgi:tripartite ATP-independent transporter DctM subunit|nr:TRAP transporter large permease [Myxococcota bacterium]
MPEAGLLLVLLACLLVIRVPVAFAIGIATVLVLGQSLPLEVTLTTTAQRLATSLDSFTLLAIPLFILAGELMGRGGIAERLINLARAALASLPKGLAHVHILASMLFGSLSGSAVAAASAVGGVMGPRMQREGYSAGSAAAVNISSATTGLLIPPSNVLIIYSLASGGVSITALFVAGYIPGLLVGLALAVAVQLSLPGPVVQAPSGPRLGRAFLEALPSLGLPLLVMGGIVTGIFTPTEASAIAVLYAGALSLVYRRLRFTDLPSVFADAAITTGTVALLIATSMALSWLLAFEQIPQGLAAGLMAGIENPLALLLAINLLLLVVGTFMDMTPAILIFAPIFVPVAVGMGIDPVHFGVMMVLNLSIGLCTPPVGTVLFVGCGVAGTSLGEVIRPLLPMYLAMLGALALVAAFPTLSLGLPRFLGYLSP